MLCFGPGLARLADDIRLTSTRWLAACALALGVGHARAQPVTVALCAQMPSASGGCRDILLPDEGILVRKSGRRPPGGLLSTCAIPASV